MEEIEIEGKSIDEAIGKACDLFRVPREKLNIEIIAEGNAGFLGLGAKKAKIRASRLSIDEVFSAVEGPDRPTPVPVESDPVVGPSPEGSEKKEGGALHRREKGMTQPPRRGKTVQVSSRSAAAPEAKTAAPKAEGAVQKTFPTAAAAQTGESAAEKAKRLLVGILTRMEIPYAVELEETEGAIVLNIRGDGSGLLIGKRGQNLDAIQYILNKAVHHSANGHKMILIDTEEYRKRREESLVALAVRLGEKVKKTKKPVTVGHMNAHDRRIIHMAMRDDENLTTKSRGEGEYRKILILPSGRGSDSSAA